MVQEIQNPTSLKHFFELTGIKQGFKATQWGISPSYLSELVSEKARPGSDLARTISRDTGIPLESLLFPDEQEVA